MVTSILRLLAAFGLALSLFACGGETGALTAVEAQEVLRYQYPLSHAENGQSPNSVIGEIAPGQSVRIVRRIDAKDYRSYEVELDDGTIGYVIYNSKIDVDWE